MRKIEIDKFREFAQKHVYWWGKERPNIDVLATLSFILAQCPPYVEKMAREQFGFTDQDFAEALKVTPPGSYWGVAPEEHWRRNNLRLGINPPLPFPDNRQFISSFCSDDEKKEIDNMKYKYASEIAAFMRD